MSQIKLTADSGGGSVSLKAPATTTSNAALEITVPDVATGSSVVTADSSGHVALADNKKIKLGTGGDLQIYHDGTDSYVKEGTGDLILQSTADDIIMRAVDDIHIQTGSSSDLSIFCAAGGEVSLYHNAELKLSTSATGVDIQDASATNVWTKLSNSSGTAGYVYGNGATEIGFLDGQQHWTVKSTKDGVVDLYCDNVVKFSTHANGAQLHGDSLLRHDGWRGLLDRSWDDYPSISISPDTTYGNQTELRIHGDSASNLGYLGGGSNFALDVRCDGSYENGSDRRRKTNIEEITGALATVKQLTGKKFNIINRQGDLDPNRGTRKQFGLIAQECEDIIPEVVKFHPDENTPNENGWCSAYGLDYGQLTPLLINAVKELSAEVDTLKTKVAALEAA